MWTHAWYSNKETKETFKMSLFKLKETADPTSELRYKLCENSQLEFIFTVTPAGWVWACVCCCSRSARTRRLSFRARAKYQSWGSGALMSGDERFHRGQSGLQVVSSSGRALLPSLLETLSLCHAICWVCACIKEDREEYDKCPVCAWILTGAGKCRPYAAWA